MTKVAVAGQLPSSNVLNFGSGAGDGGGGGVAVTLKRKTPSELRGELLKRKNIMEFVDEFPDPFTGSSRNENGALFGPKRSDLPKVPKYVDTRMNELFPVTKNSMKLKLLSRKQNPTKESLSGECIGGIKNSFVPMNQKYELTDENSCIGEPVASEARKNHSNQANNTTEKCCNITFQSVQELSKGGEKLNCSSNVDMDQALKGLVFREPHTASDSLAKSVDRSRSTESICSEFHLLGHDIPLDLTLKTSLRLLSSSSVNWLHRLFSCNAINGYQLPNVGCAREIMISSSEPIPTSQVTNSGILHSWVYPQSTLPQSAISILTSAAAGTQDFLGKRQQAWEDSFRSLYYMLRKKICKLFYVCTHQFVVLFTGYHCSKETKYSCRAYVSQSTRSLRALLKKQDVSFSMPLCRSKVEEVTAEDLVELSEIEKYNLGQTRATETMIGVDNSPQSLLMFTGNKNIHGLYDFLLNYRFSLPSLTGSDVPMLYSPVPFENAALSAPEVRCRQMRKVDYITSELKESNIYTETNGGSSAGICYSVEVKDAYLPPWIVSGICSAMRSNGADFQASFVTESTSIGLNAGLDIASGQPAQQATSDKPLQENCHSFGIPNAVVSSKLQFAILKGLKHSGDSYTASLSRVL